VSDPDTGRRARRAAERTSRHRPVQIAVALGVVILLTVLAVVLFAGGGGSGKAKHKAIKVSANVKLVAGQVKNENAGAAAQLSADAQATILKSVARYVDDGVIKPAEKHRKAADLSPLFDQGAAARQAGFDRAALYEESLPKVTALKAQADPVELTGLSDANGAFVLVTAKFNLTLDAKTEAGAVTVKRATELTFAPQSNEWRITSYDVRVERSGPGTGITTPGQPPNTTKTSKP
jgi:hypothetical protein